MAKRVAHVKRIWKSDDDGNPIEDVWIDVLRIDKLPINFQSTDKGIQGQTINFSIHWVDDPNNPPLDIDANNPQVEDANRTRQSRKLYIKNPTSPDDDSQTNTLWIVDKAKIAMPQGAVTGISGQNVKFAFSNANPYSMKSADPPYDEQAPQSKRDVTVIKVVFNDLNGFNMEADDDGSGVVKSKLVDWGTYKQALIDGAKVDNPSLDVEVVDTFKIVFGSDALTGAQGQTIKYVLGANQELEPGKQGSSDPPLFDLGNPDATDVNQDPSVIRTDPLQIIVNANLESNNFVVFGYRYEVVSDVETPKNSFIMYSLDGLKWVLADKVPNLLISGMAYGKKIWLAIGNNTIWSSGILPNEVWRSKDLFKTWEKCKSAPLSVGANDISTGNMCYGKPVDAKRASDNANKNGVFIVGSGDKLQSSDDLGDSWSIVTITGSKGYHWGVQLVRFMKGIFYAIAIGTNNDGPDPVPSICKLYKCKDGNLWDDGTEILRVITGKTFTIPDDDKTYYASLAVRGFLYRVKDKTFMVSGLYSDGQNKGHAFCSVSSDPAVFNSLDHEVDGVVMGGGCSAITGDSSIVSIQNDRQEKASMDWVRTQWIRVLSPQIHVSNETARWFNSASDSEGVMAPDFSTNYFCGGTNTVIKVHLEQPDPIRIDTSPPITIQCEKYDPNPVETSGPEAEANLNFRSGVMANGFKDKDNKDSKGTFIWTRTMSFPQPSYPSVPGVNKGFEIWRSQDGIAFKKINHPLSAVQAFHSLAQGTVPAIPKDQQ